MSFLTLTGVQKTFPGGTVAVEDFNLEAVRGEFVSFLGPSGCGKTTTLRMIAGFEKPTAGTIVVDGTDITYRSPNQRNVGMVFQSYALFPNMTVADNIGFGLKVRKRPKSEITKRVKELLELIHLEDRAGRYPVPDVGRPAAAGGSRAGARDRAAGAPARRAPVGARRQDPDRPAQGDPGHPAPARHHDGLRDPRPGGGALAVRPGRRHERWPDRADRDPVRDLQLPVDRLRRVVRRDAQPGQRGRHRRRRGPAVDRRPGGPDEQGRSPAPATMGGSRWPSGRRASRCGEAGPEARTTSAASSRTSTSSARSSGSGSGFGDGVDGATPTVVALDTFNEPHLKVPDVGEYGHRVVPAGGVLRPRRGARWRRWRRRRPARRCDRPPRRHRPRRLRQGRDDHRVRRHVERLGGGARSGAPRRDRPVRRRAAVRDARISTPRP